MILDHRVVSFDPYLQLRKPTLRFRLLVRVSIGTRWGVVSLRDVRGLTAAEVYRALDLTPADQGTLLYQARATLCTALEDYYRS